VRARQTYSSATGGQFLFSFGDRVEEKSAWMDLWRQWYYGVGEEAKTIYRNIPAIIRKHFL
jgi:hypothetical protein